MVPVVPVVELVVSPTPVVPPAPVAPVPEPAVPVVPLPAAAHPLTSAQPSPTVIESPKPKRQNSHRRTSTKARRPRRLG